MIEYYFAYHSDKNGYSFDNKAGYGVKEKGKIEKIKTGDRVFIIQKTKSKKFELCGVYEVEDKYENPAIEYQYRLKLSDLSNLEPYITINESEISDLLPEINTNVKWNNFMRHFCRQGASLQNKLSDNVIQILLSLLPTPIETLIFDKKVSEIRKLPKEKRDEKISEFPLKPKRRLVQRYEYDRNPYVTAEVLERANGFCELCHSPAPFIKKSTGDKYLEVHHKQQLSKNGDDSVGNCIAICPNCHRNEHYGDGDNLTKN